MTDQKIKMRYCFSNKDRSILLAVLSGIAVNLNAQNFEIEKKHELTLSYGQQSITDTYLGITSTKINSTGVGYFYLNQTSRGQKSLVVDFEYGKQENLRSSAYLIEFKKGYSILSSKKINNFLGFSVKNGSQFLRSYERNSWTSVNTLSLFNSFNYSGKKSLLSLNVSIPVAGFVSRPSPGREYEGSVNSMLYSSLSNHVFTSFHNYQEIDLLLNYYRYISNRVSLSAGLSFSDQNVQMDNSFKRNQIYLRSGISYYLK